MIKADGTDFCVEGNTEELIQDFGGICIALLDIEFKVDDLLDIVNQAKNLYEEHKIDIQRIED